MIPTCAGILSLWISGVCSLCILQCSVVIVLAQHLGRTCCVADPFPHPPPSQCSSAPFCFLSNDFKNKSTKNVKAYRSALAGNKISDWQSVFVLMVYCALLTKFFIAVVNVASVLYQWKIGV